MSLVADGVSLHLQDRAVLSQVSVSIQRGQLLGIIGANGAGKSSLLKVMLGIAQASQGTVSLDGQSLLTMPMRERARKVAYLAQGHATHWPLAVRDVVALGRIPHARDAPRDAHIVHEAMHETDTLGLQARNVQSLSGGERARVLLARALAVQAPVLLADEPLAALDPAHQLRIMHMLRALADQGQAVAVVLHDMVLATRFCTQLVLMQDGRVLAAGKPSDVCSDDNLARGFGVCVRHIDDDGLRVSLPWALAQEVIP